MPKKKTSTEPFMRMEINREGLSKSRFKRLRRMLILNPDYFNPDPNQNCCGSPPRFFNRRQMVAIGGR